MTSGRLEGKTFEEILQFHAKHRGLLIKKNHLTAKYIGKRIVVEKSNLDFFISNQNGIVAFVDAKTFNASSFSYSEITDHQIERAKLLNDYNIRAGFVVYLRKANVVVYYSGRKILLKGPGNSFTAADGVPLGTIHDLDPRIILEQSP